MTTGATRGQPLLRSTSGDAPSGEANASANGRIPSLDGLRAVAILIVIAYHLANTLKAPFWHARSWFVLGASGVDVFFAISGFLITTLLLREKERSGTVSLRGFYARRCVRILPAFFAYLAAMAVFNHFGLIHAAGRDWLAALTYTANFVPAVTTPLSHIWSLSVEEHFYLVWPVVFLFAGMRRAGVIALVCLIAEPLVRVLCVHFAAGYIDIDFATPARLDAIAAGCLMAVLAQKPVVPWPLRLVEARPRLAATTAIAVFLTSIFVLSGSGKYAITVRPTVHAVAICVVIWSAVRCPTTVVGRLLNFAPLAWVGRLSYSLYLWQQVFLDRSNSGQWMCHFPQNLILAFGGATASYYLIERPILAWRRRPRGTNVRIATADARGEPSVRTTLIGATCLALQPLALNALSIPVMAYIIHRLGPGGYGQWMTAVSLLGVCAIVTNLGLRGAFVRAVAADPSIAATALAEQLGLRLLLSGIAAALAVSVCWLLGYPKPVLWCTVIGGAGLGLTTVATTLADLLQSLHRMKTLAAVNLVTGLMLTACTFAVASRGVGPIALAAAYLCGPTVGVLLLVVLVRRARCPVTFRCDLRRSAGLLMGSRYFAAQQFLATGSAQAEALLLPRLVGMSQFGFFSAGTLMANRLTVLPDGLCTAAYPAMVRAYARGPRDGARLVARYLAVASLAGVAVGVIAMLIAAPLGRLLFPADSAMFATIARITIWSLPLLAIEMVMGYGLNAAGKDAAQARVSAPAAVISLATSVALVMCFGVMGACWSMLLRPAVRAAFLAPLLIRNSGSPSMADLSLADEEQSATPAVARMEPQTYRKAG